ncbi:MAG: phosphoribosylamine--glycine ligase [Deltaproteobacteria bacterium]|nr:phosphoribosylamine--glycine ligase [Deltaproteobacteria bacterium]
MSSTNPSENSSVSHQCESLRILVLGSGGREHALAWRLSVGAGDVPLDDRQVFLSPGNAGAAREILCFPAAPSPVDVVALAKKERIDLVVVGPEQPLVDGVVDALEAVDIPVLGPSQACAALEGSKAHMKAIAAKAKVATASFGAFDDEKNATSFLQELAKRDPRVAIKADGLCAGKGVVLSSSLEESIECVRSFLGNDDSASPRFGEASRTIVIEEFLDGEELSIFALCDGEDVHLFGCARDHKRLLDDDIGPNTGGMGAVGPLSAEYGVGDAMLERVRREVFLPVLKTLSDEGTPYRGFLYAGLMVDGDDVKLLEFNVRFGDPEAQALFFATSVDLLPSFWCVARHQKLAPDDKSLRNCVPVATVVLASEGYPEAPQIGRRITFNDDAKDALDKETKIFWAGVRSQKDHPEGLETAGGRVLCISARGVTVDDAVQRAYAGAEKISFDGKHSRADIGKSLLPKS